MPNPRHIHSRSLHPNHRRHEQKNPNNNNRNIPTNSRNDHIPLLPRHSNTQKNNPQTPTTHSLKQSKIAHQQTLACPTKLFRTKTKDQLATANRRNNSQNIPITKQRIQPLLQRQTPPINQKLQKPPNITRLLVKDILNKIRPKPPTKPIQNNTHRHFPLTRKLHNHLLTPRNLPQTRKETHRHPQQATLRKHRRQHQN